MAIKQLIAKRNAVLITDCAIQFLAGLAAWIIVYGLIGIFTTLIFAAILKFLFQESPVLLLAPIASTSLVLALSALAISIILPQAKSVGLFDSLQDRSLRELQHEVDYFGLSKLLGTGGPISRNDFEFYFVPFTDGFRLMLNGYLSFSRRLPNSPDFPEKLDKLLHETSLDPIQGQAESDEFRVLLILKLLEVGIDLEGQRIFRLSPLGAQLTGARYMPDHLYQAREAKNRLAIR